jgi:hypothetical protein
MTDPIIEHVLAHNSKYAGGSQTIAYHGGTVTAPVCDIQAAIEELLHLTAGDRQKALASVTRALDKNRQKVFAGEATQAQAMAYMEDVAIWYANEVLEGRATLAITQ